MVDVSDPVKGSYSLLYDRDNMIFEGHIRAGAVSLSKLGNDVLGFMGQPVQSLYVNTISGNDGSAGTSWATAKATMAAAFLIALDNAVIYVIGDIREQINAPLGIQGVKIVGAAGGGVRHDDGVRWRTPASPDAGVPLLTLREQGWELHNLLMVPIAGVSCVRLRRAEDATWPDGSHAIFNNVKMIGDDATPAGVGIESHGGSSHNQIYNSQFFGLVTAIAHTTGVGIASPLRWRMKGNWFQTNTNHIVLPANQSIIEGNVFDTATKVIDTSGGTEGKNYVLNNQFSDNLADIDNAHGYTGHATDVWRNLSADTADVTVGVPGA